MAYNNSKSTENLYWQKFLDVWVKFIDLDNGNIIRKITQFVYLVIHLGLVPFGCILSLFNYFYNLQKEAYDKIKGNHGSEYDQFSDRIEFVIPFLLAIPFAIILFPLWLICKIFSLPSNHY